jgi:hypothetical protein
MPAADTQPASTNNDDLPHSHRCPCCGGRMIIIEDRFPDLADALKSLPGSAIIDTELVHPNGFELLHRQLHAAQRQ